MENAVNFEATQDPSIFAVDGLSTDNDLIQAIGTGTKPKNAKYYQFRDGVFAVVKERGAESYRVRQPRSTSSTPTRSVDPLTAFRQLDVEMAQKRAALRGQLEAKIAGLREEIHQAEEALQQLSQTH